MVGDGTNNDTTFYITLTIEQDDDDDDPLERIDSKIFFPMRCRKTRHRSHNFLLHPRGEKNNVLQVKLLLERLICV